MSMGHTVAVNADMVDWSRAPNSALSFCRNIFLTHWSNGYLTVLTETETVLTSAPLSFIPDRAGLLDQNLEIKIASLYFCWLWPKQYAQCSAGEKGLEREPWGSPFLTGACWSFWAICQTNPAVIATTAAKLTAATQTDAMIHFRRG